MNSEEFSELVTLANKGDSSAQNSLGAKLAQTGDEKNLTAALYWYLKAVENGYVDSMWNAATMLIAGEGGVKNREFALHLVTVAAENGNSSACLFLSNCYENGLEGFDKNQKIANKWQESAWNIDDEKDFAEPIDVDNYLNERPIKPE